MSHSREMVPRDSAWSPEFIKDLLPSAERVALLYHFSYLCLAGFPKLENLLRSRALETQFLFGFSEALLFKCIGTSMNMVNSLFPILKAAVEKDKPTLAVTYLYEAKIWIDDIINEVDDIVAKYDLHNKGVAKTTSDVITEKNEMDSKIKIKTSEVKSIEETLKMHKDNLKDFTTKLEALGKETDDKKNEMEELVQKDPRMDSRVKIKSFTLGKNELPEKKCAIQNEVIRCKIAVENLIKDLGSIPPSELRNEVQVSLSRIQQILIQLHKFWERIGVMLDYLKDKTFVGEDLIEDLDIFKQLFLKSVADAEKAWKKFGDICTEAKGIFSAQTKDDYKFLEVSASFLSKVEWQKQYDAVKEKLEKIYPPTATDGSDITYAAAKAIDH